MKAMTDRVILSELTTAELAALPERQFKVVVDADIRRGAIHQPQRVPAWVSDALRNEHCSRWLATLRAMLASVDSQLDAADIEHRARLTVASSEAERDRLSEKHHEITKAAVRFRSALLVDLTEAEALLQKRATKLEAAITAHRNAVVADPTIEPSAADRDLWAVLST